MVTFLIPAGPMNLQTLFPGIDFRNIDEYYLELIDSEDQSAVLTTPAYKRNCCCDKDTIRLFFVNYLGSIDSVNFRIITEEHEVISSRWKKPLKAPLQKWDGGIQRFNVTSNESVIAENTCFKEIDQPWLMELMDAPNAWVQWPGTQGQGPDYIPIVIRDKVFVPRKNEERYNYVLQIQFDYANENIPIRN